MTTQHPITYKRHNPEFWMLNIAKGMLVGTIVAILFFGGYHIGVNITQSAIDREKDDLRASNVTLQNLYRDQSAVLQRSDTDRAALRAEVERMRVEAGLIDNSSYRQGIYESCITFGGGSESDCYDYAMGLER